MREIRTSGSRRGKATLDFPGSLLYSTREDDQVNPFEEVLCYLARLDFMLQEGDEEFVCHDFEPRE